MSENITIPENYTEKEVVRIIDKVARRLAPKFRFGYHGIEDIEQEARLMAWRAIPAYDTSSKKGTLENFLFAHVHNRLHNYKRDNFERLDKPCKKCPINQFSKKLDKCKKYKEDCLEDCEFYYGWILRNQAKRNLMDPADIDGIDDKNEHNMWISENDIDNIDYTNLVKKIKDKIPIASLENFNRFIAGTKLNRMTKIKIKEMIIKILEEEGHINND